MTAGSEVKRDKLCWNDFIVQNSSDESPKAL